MERYDAIVLGAGGVGSAALYHLARRGIRVLGIDRFNPPHDRGSTHGHTRVIRQAYYEHPNYAPLLKESYREWNDLESRVGKQLFHQIGLIEIGPADGVVVPGVLRVADEHQLSVQPFTAAEIESRWPGLRVGNDLTGVFEPTAGYLLVEDCVQAHLDAARAAGAKTLFNAEVVGWTTIENDVRVRMANGVEIAASRLIIAAGAWAGQIVPPLPWGEDRGEGNSQAIPHPDPLPMGEGTLPLSVRRKSLFWFAADGTQYDIAGGMPVFLFELPAGVFYGFPKLDARGVKIAEHSGGRSVDDPLSVDRTIDADEKRRLEDVLARHLPGVSPRVTDHAVCLYTMSPDEHFIVDRHPALPNVVFAAGLSGHGFKFAPVLGRALADLAMNGGTDLPIDFFSLGRFARE